MNTNAFGSPRLERLVKRLGRLPGIGSKSAARLALYLLHAEDRGSPRADAGDRGHEDACPALPAMRRHRRGRSLLDLHRRTPRVPTPVRGGPGHRRVHHGAGRPSFAAATTCSAASFRRWTGSNRRTSTWRSLRQRIDEESVTEVVMALSASVEGEATALFIRRMLEAPRDLHHPPGDRDPRRRAPGVRGRRHPGEGLHRPSTPALSPPPASGAADSAARILAGRGPGVLQDSPGRPH